MTPQSFIHELEQIFERSLKEKQAPLYLDKLRRFSSEQLLELLNRTLEEAKYFPKISEIYKAAAELGYLHVDLTRTRLHNWEPSDCAMCRGEGRLAVFWELLFEERGTGRFEVHQFKSLVPYSRSSSYSLSENEFSSIFRCSCMAGEAATLPKAWPKWSIYAPLRREA